MAKQSRRGRKPTLERHSAPCNGWAGGNCPHWPCRFDHPPGVLQRDRIACYEQDRHAWDERALRQKADAARTANLERDVKQLLQDEDDLASIINNDGARRERDAQIRDALEKRIRELERARQAADSRRESAEREVTLAQRRTREEGLRTFRAQRRADAERSRREAIEDTCRQRQRRQSHSFKPSRRHNERTWPHSWRKTR